LAQRQVPLDVAPYLAVQARLNIGRGARYAFALAVVMTVPCLALLVSGDAFFRLPAAFGALCMVFTCAFLLLTRAGLMEGPLLYGMFVLFAFLPTTFALLAHALLPAGAATFINGPISALYLFVVFVSGFAFQPRLSVLCGVTAALGYLTWFALARSSLAALQHPDPTLLQDLQSPVIHLLRATLMVFAGLLASAISGVARALLVRALTEEHEKQGISRLFGQFVSHPVKEKLIREKTGVIGERRDVAVLFSDLRSFSTYSETQDPAALVIHLNQYFDRMCAAVEQHGGVVDKFIGDAVMAVFGGVIELENPSLAAVRAAQQMRRELAVLNVRWKTEGLPELQCGIGIHFGPVLQGTLGSAERKEFTVMGDAVNTAARLESVTKEQGHPILVSGAVHGRLPAELQRVAVPLGDLMLKGKKVPVPVFGLQDQGG
jgi:adenylate cyclase